MSIKSIFIVTTYLCVCCTPQKQLSLELDSNSNSSNALIYVKYAVVNLFFEEPQRISIYGPGELYLNENMSYFHWNYVHNDTFDIPKNNIYISLPKDAADETGNIIQIDTKNGKLLQRENFGQYFYTEEPVPSFDWEISNNKRSIAGMQAIQASTKFRGREYVAWFTTDIPVSHGPWKFYGLPGLILEIQDKSGDFSYKAIAIKYPYSGNVPNPKRDIGKKISWEEFTVIDQKAKKELEKETLARNNDRDGTLQVTIYDQIRQEIFSSKSTNF